MTTQNKLTSIIETLTNQVSNGVTMKNVRRGLELKNLPSEMVNKLMRMVELEVVITGC